MSDFQTFFKLGMKRDVPPVLNMPEQGLVLNLGAGYSPIYGAVSIDWPEWDADSDPLPYDDETVDGIHAYHFLEHLADPKRVLREMQRVLKVGGIAQIVVPYYSSPIAHHDLDHKSWFTEDTWRNTFTDVAYAKGHKGWRWHIGFNVIAGIAERNLCLMTQLIKT